MGIDFLTYFPVILFIILLILIITERFDRTVITSNFAILLLIFGAITFEEAVKSIDFNTIGLLTGMMIIVSVIAKTGFFQYLAIKSLKISKGRPIRLLILLSFLTAFLSMALDNVTTILLMTPVTLYITKILSVSALPFVLSLIFFSNIGGTATLIGDPPNIIIASISSLTFNDFLIYNGPFVLINLFFGSFLLFFLFKKKLREKIISKSLLEKIKEDNLIHNKRMLIRSLVVFSFVIIGFITHNITHIENSIIALSGAFLILLIVNLEPDDIYKEIEWASIFFFIGLFILISGIEKTGILEFFARRLIDLTGGEGEITSYAILWLVGLLSGFVDNIPITLVFSEVIKELSSMNVGVFSFWWALSLGACLGGNLTLIGASANIIGVDIFNKNNETKEKINFKLFFKYGLIMTFTSLVLATFYLKIIFFL